MRTLIALLLVAGCTTNEIHNDTVQEHEPNDGATPSEHETATLAKTATGAIGTAGDVDVYFVDVAPGQRLVAKITVGADSQLQPHLTVMDAGRGTHAAGEDYKKLITGDVQWVSMGEGGYYVIVRDARNVGSSGAGTIGSPQHTYELTVEVATPSISTLQASDTGAGSLTNPGAIAIYELDAGTGGDLLFDAARTTASSKLDLRVIVYSLDEKDWVAQQDDRSGSNVDPLVDAPIGGGLHWIVVENVEPTATAFGYDFSSTFP